MMSSLSLPWLERFQRGWRGPGAAGWALMRLAEIHSGRRGPDASGGAPAWPAGLQRGWRGPGVASGALLCLA